MDVSYRRDKDHNYMILDAPGELTGEEYQVRMLVGNHIPHLLKCNRRMMDGKAVFFYEVTGMQPMFRVFEKRQINQEEMVELLQDIKEALENTQRYLLDGNQLLFEPEFLFFHTQTREWNLCYLPTYDGNMTESFRKLSEYLLKRLDHSDEQAVMLGYEVYSKASEENYRISEVLQMIYQVGRKNCAQEEGLPEDPEQSEKVKISKESEVSEQENTSVIRRFFSFFPNVECEKNNIKFIYNVMRREKTIPVDMIPIADDPTGNVICISLSSNDYGAVYFLNHEFEDSDTGYLMKSKITDSFKVFIEKLYPDE